MSSGSKPSLKRVKVKEVGVMPTSFFVRQRKRPRHLRRDRRPRLSDYERAPLALTSHFALGETKRGRRNYFSRQQLLLPLLNPLLLLATPPKRMRRDKRVALRARRCAIRRLKGSAVHPVRAAQRAALCVFLYEGFLTRRCAPRHRANRGRGPVGPAGRRSRPADDT